MQWGVQILLVVAVGVAVSAHQNPTFLPEGNQLFKPIIIPNITEYFHLPAGTAQPEEPQALQPRKETLQKSSPENKFSARYSTKGEGRGKESSEEARGAEEAERRDGEIVNEGAEERKKFSDRSDDVTSSAEEREDVQRYFDGNEPEESEVSPTTNEPYQDLARPTSFRIDADEDFKSYETTSAEEKESSEEEGTEDRKSVYDYHNADSRNYHSVQTPLSKIQYRGPHSIREGFDSERVRSVSPIRRHPIAHNWPYSRSHLKAELEKENEISESEESSLEEGVREELKRKPSALELAAERDESRFEKNRNYNHLEERNRGKQKVKSLVAQEEKDHRRLPFPVLNQYQVSEDPRHHTPKKLPFNEEWSSKQPLIATPSNNERRPKPSKPNVADELTSSFRSPQFLGPVVFSHNLDQQKAKLQVKKAPGRSIKALLEKEKLDQDNISNQRIHKSIFGTGNGGATSHGFNHLEESVEMYNAILANIQSVFGLRGQAGGRSSEAGVNLEESKALTWSMPLVKRSKVD